MNILITGGLGYIGGRIASYLKEQLPADNIILSTINRKYPSWSENFTVLQMDLLDSKAIENCLDNSDADVIIHLAAINEIDSMADPELAMKVNTLGTEELLKKAIANNVSRFIYFSTAHVYGSALRDTVTEDIVAAPTHPYAVTHKAAEDFVLTAHEQKKIAGIVLRLSNAFGAPMDADVNRWTLLVNDLCRQAVISGKLVLRSSGLAVRDFAPLSDVARCVEFFLKLPIKSYDNGLFNVGGQCPLSIIDMAERIAKRCVDVLGFKPPIQRPQPLPNEKNYPLDYCIDKLKAAGFAVTADFDSEIDSTLKLCKNAFGADTRC